MHLVKKTFLRVTCMALRRLPWESVRWRFLPWALRSCQETFVSEEYRVIRLRHSFRLKVDLSDWLGRHCFVTGEYEAATTRVVVALLKPGGRVVDVGANVGYFSLLAARCVGALGHVLAFEPVPVVREHLLENIKLNGFANCEVRSEALCDRSGETVNFYEGPRNHRGVSSLRALSDSDAVHTVRTMRLDDLPPGQKPIALIKIDVEGAELLALYGMRQSLERDRPDLIIEVTDSFLSQMGHSAQMLCHFLKNLGYQMYEIGNDGLTRIQSLGDQEFSGQFNALFSCKANLPAEILQAWR
jgi:FkbM family methyltransferase